MVLSLVSQLSGRNARTPFLTRCMVHQRLMQPPHQETKGPPYSWSPRRLHTARHSRVVLSVHRSVVEGPLPGICAGKLQGCSLVGSQTLFSYRVGCGKNQETKSIAGKINGRCSDAQISRIQENGVSRQRKLSLGPRLNGHALKPPQGPRGANVRLGACRSKRVGLSDSQCRMSPPTTPSNEKITVTLT